MKIASLLGGSLALGGGIVKFMDIADGSHDSYTAALALSLIGLLLIGAGFIGRQNQKSTH